MYSRNWPALFAKTNLIIDKKVEHIYIYIYIYLRFNFTLLTTGGGTSL